MIHTLMHRSDFRPSLKGTIALKITNFSHWIFIECALNSNLLLLPIFYAGTQDSILYESALSSWAPAPPLVDETRPCVSFFVTHPALPQSHSPTVSEYSWYCSQRVIKWALTFTSQPQTVTSLNLLSVFVTHFPVASFREFPSPTSSPSIFTLVLTEYLCFLFKKFAKCASATTDSRENTNPRGCRGRRRG